MRFEVALGEPLVGSGFGGAACWLLQAHERSYLAIARHGCEDLADCVSIEIWLGNFHFLELLRRLGDTIREGT